MQRRLLFNEFSKVFRDNVLKRSRTANGVAEVGMSGTQEEASELGRKKVRQLSRISEGNYLKMVAERK